MSEIITGEVMLSGLGQPTMAKGRCRGLKCGEPTVEFVLPLDGSKVTWCAAGHVYVVDPNASDLASLVYKF
jgi:hypothetical protein